MPSIRATLVIAFVICCVTAIPFVFSAPQQDESWQSLQERYAKLAKERNLPAIDVAIRETPGVNGTAERCVTCHITQGGAAPIPGDDFFAAHPPIPHDPEVIGCTVCHGGDGTATGLNAAHGEAATADPLLEREVFEAGCGSCHRSIPVANPHLAGEGAKLVEQYACTTCHKLGVDEAPGGAYQIDLSEIGFRGLREGWYEMHWPGRVTAVDRGLGGYKFDSDADPEEVAAIAAYLETRVGMPQLTEGKRLFHLHGCRSCHQVDGIGGDLGKDHSDFGRRSRNNLITATGDTAELSRFQRVQSYLMNPPFLEANGALEHPKLDENDAKSVALYMLSLRDIDMPREYWPPDRVKTQHFGYTEFADDGKTLFGIFCTSCHGERGQGRLDLFADNVPAITNLDTLAIASDDFLYHSIAAGRPGRRMPAWNLENGGLTSRDMRELVRYMRSFEPDVPSFAEVNKSHVETVRGWDLYSRDCQPCHGTRSEGILAPSHLSPAFKALVSDRFLYETIVEGRPGTAMPSYREYDAVELKSLIACVRELATAITPPVDLLTREVPLGLPKEGKPAYEKNCQSCHGPSGIGARGPAIGNWAFQRAAGEVFVIESYVRRRCTNELGGHPPPLDAAVLADIAAYLAEESRSPEHRVAQYRIEGDSSLGKARFDRTCALCHGSDGNGGPAPSLVNKEFLAAASDGFLLATMVRGHRTGMPRFEPSGEEANPDDLGFPSLTADEIRGIVAYIRRLGEEHAKREED